jgi:hypothetical protein
VYVNVCVCIYSHVYVHFHIYKYIMTFLSIYQFMDTEIVSISWLLWTTLQWIGNTGISLGCVFHFLWVYAPQRTTESYGTVMGHLTGTYSEKCV